VSGLRTDLPTLKRLVSSFNVTSGGELQLDPKAYGSSQKLATVLCKKGQAPRWVHGGREHAKGPDDRVLEPVGWEEWENKHDVERLKNYVAQCVGDKDPYLGGTAASDRLPEAPRRRRRDPETGEWVAVDTGMQQEQQQQQQQQQHAGPEQGRTGKRARKTVFGLDMAWDVMQPVLHQNGFLNPRILPGSESYGDKFHCYFDCDNHLDCKICGYDHESHHYYFNAYKGGVNVGNYSERCRCISLFDLVFLHKDADKLKDRDYFCHSQYAHMYAEYTNDMLKYDIQNKKFMGFKGAVWEEVPREAIKADVCRYFGQQLCENMVKKVDMWTERASMLGMTELTEYLDDMKREFKKRMRDVGNMPFLTNVVAFLEGIVFVDTSVFNPNDHLLHFDDCVLDLNTMETRNTLPSDMNTFTTGFNFYQDDVDEEGIRLHDRVVQTIFTDERVRRVAQKVFGTSLSAHPIKYFFVHTDGGGEKAGNNGKTLLMDLHHDTLGGYACRPRRELFYRQTSSDSNCATTALIGVIGKRVGVAEELESTKQLNESEIKHWTNGTNPMVAARQLYHQQHMARLVCKFHVGANNNKFPKCDAIGDQALKDRLFIIPYMSKFVNMQHDRPMDKVFVRDSSLSSKLQCMRWPHMMWCLEGYKAYKEEGLDHDGLPPFMKQFKDGVLVQQSPVYGILMDILVKADPEEVRQNERKGKGLDVRAVWDAVMNDKRFRGYMDQGMVEQAFKSICKGHEGCERCIRYDSEHRPYSTHHKLVERGSRGVNSTDTNMGDVFM
jgi:hypothetical protein